MYPPHSVYNKIHGWLKDNYGKASKCENIDCPGLIKKYHWSKLRDCVYEFNRENFWMLCITCHKRYDNSTQLPLIERELCREFAEKRQDFFILLEEFSEKINIPVSRLKEIESRHSCPTLSEFFLFKSYCEKLNPHYKNYKFVTYFNHLEYKKQLEEGAA